MHLGSVLGVFAPVAQPDEAFDGPTDDEPITEALPALDGSESTPDESEAPAEPEPDAEPAPPPPVTPAPEAEDVEDLMFVDADIDAAEPPDGSPR